MFGNAMPKSGSHLLLQVLQGLCQVAPFAYVESEPVRVLTRLGERRTQKAILSDLRRLPRGVIGWGYLPAERAYREILTQPGWVSIFILRDPRDMLVSQVYYATEMYEQHRMRAYYLSLPDFDARLKAAIQGVDQEGAHLPDVRERFNRFLGWLGCPGVLTVRFEELIADREGSIHTILDHLEAAGSHLREIHDLENEADGLSRAAIGRLFRNGLDAVEVIKLRDLYKVLEETIDAAEDAAEVIERIAAKHQ